MQLPGWVLEISILYPIISSICTFCWYIMICHLCTPHPPHPPFPFAQYLLALFAGLGVTGELDSYFFSLHALIFSHAAWLTGSWSAHTELLIAAPHHHLPCTHKYIQYTISVWLGQVRKLFFSDSCDFCFLTKTPKGSRQGGIILHDSFFSSALASHTSCKHAHTHTPYIKYNNTDSCWFVHTLKSVQLGAKESGQC